MSPGDSTVVYITLCSSVMMMLCPAVQLFPGFLDKKRSIFNPLCLPFWKIQRNFAHRSRFWSPSLIPKAREMDGAPSPLEMGRQPPPAAAPRAAAASTGAERPGARGDGRGGAGAGAQAPDSGRSTLPAGVQDFDPADPSRCGACLAPLGPAVPPWDKARLPCCGGFLCAACGTNVIRAARGDEECPRCGEIFLPYASAARVALLRRKATAAQAAPAGTTATTATTAAAPWAMALLSEAYREGAGVSNPAPKLAREWARKAAVAGHVAAAHSLATMLLDGYGGPRDDRGARAWLERAAREGHPAATATLGGMHWQGAGGLSASQQNALALFSRAAALADPDAIDVLRECLADRVPVPCSRCGCTAPPALDLVPCPGCEGGAWYCRGTSCRADDWAAHAPCCAKVRQQRRRARRPVTHAPTRVRLRDVVQDEALRGRTGVRGKWLFRQGRFAVVLDLVGEETEARRLAVRPESLELVVGPMVPRAGVGVAAGHIGGGRGSGGGSGGGAAAAKTAAVGGSGAVDLCGFCECVLPRWNWEKVRLTCCGRFLCKSCVPRLSRSKYRQCPYCAGIQPETAAEDVERLRKKADAGVPWAMGVLGNRYREGVVVPQSSAMARAWTEKAALAGDADSFFNLANFCVSGLGGEQDEVGAVVWYAKAAEVGHPGAKTALGHLNFAGRGGLEAGPQTAVKLWADDASQHGHQEAIALLIRCREEWDLPIPCSNCGKNDTRVRRCAGCKGAAWYCNEACQSAHFQAHRPVCKQVQRRRAIEAEARALAKTQAEARAKAAAAAKAKAQAEAEAARQARIDNAIARMEAAAAARDKRGAASAPEQKGRVLPSTFEFVFGDGDTQQTIRPQKHKDKDV